MSGNNTTVCALCQQTRTLRNSHIIPEFLHAPLYEENPRRYNTYGVDGRPKLGVLQKGEREHLLCDECEGRFSIFERWASDFYRGAIVAFSDTTRSEIPYGKKLRFTRVDSDGKPTTSAVPRKLMVDGFDYEKMKLFLLSLLWRMGVSQLLFFSRFTLGHQEQRLRRMLLENDPGSAERYACQIRLIELEGKLVTDYQSQPFQYEHRGKKCCRLFSTGVRFDFMVSNHPADGHDVDLYCVKPQPRYVCWVDSIRTHPDLADELIKLGAEMKWTGSKNKVASFGYSPLSPQRREIG